MKVRIKREKGAKLPYRATEGSAGYDLTAVSYDVDPFSNAIVYDTGLTFELPKGTFLLVRPRSSIYRLEWSMLGSGVIDEDYRGTVKMMLGPQTQTLTCGRRFPTI
jgi:dUTP pyrophosphatase